MDKILKKMMGSPEMLTPIIKEYINKYKPVVYDLALEIVKVYNDYSNNTEFPMVIAKCKKNVYDAYISVGFTEDQALAFMLNDNIQLMKTMKQLSASSSFSSRKGTK